MDTVLQYAFNVQLLVQLHMYTMGYVKTISIIAHSSSAAQNYRPILSGALAHGQCATFKIYVEAFGAELLFYFIVLDR